MKKFAVLLMAMVLPLVLAANASCLTITVYTDKTAWADAVGGPYGTETFTDKVLEPGVTYTTTKGLISPKGYWHDTLTSGSYYPSLTIWQFAPDIFAYGGVWTLGGPGGSGNSLVVTLGDSGVTAGTINSGFYGEFWGFVSDAPFSSVKLVGGTGTNQMVYFLDNMVYAPVLAAENVSFLAPRVAAVATPLPGAFWFVGPGLLALLGLMRSKS